LIEAGSFDLAVSHSAAARIATPISCAGSPRTRIVTADLHRSARRGGHSRRRRCRPADDEFAQEFVGEISTYHGRCGVDGLSQEAELSTRSRNGIRLAVPDWDDIPPRLFRRARRGRFVALRHSPNS
jgi:hypothetical protein